MVPLPFIWNGEAMEVRKGFQRQADEHFVIGETYRLAPVEDRSDATHKHEFAFVREAWNTLPERYADQFATPEHLRKAALIATGFYHEAIVDAGTNAAALRVAAFMRAKDEFARVVVRGPLVVERTAKSQSYRAMGKADFQASKTAILEWIAGLLDVSPDALRAAA